MSVREMGRLLGLGKTESYYLVKKNYFKVITVGATMRVMIPSFEEWYANQSFYKKVDGPEPGSQLKLTSMSAEELGALLGISEASAYDLIAKGHFKRMEVLGKMRISNESFWKWYATQSIYRTIGRISNNYVNDSHAYLTYRGVEVYFNPSSTKGEIDSSKIHQRVKFGVGFSYDGPRAYNTSIRLLGKDEYMEEVRPLTTGMVVKCEVVKNVSFLYPFLSLRSGTKRYENVFLSLFFLYNSSYRELGILQITGR